MALQAALQNGDPREWGRLKLMFIGQGAAGKTSTVRSLLGLTPITTHESTVGAELKLTRAEDWQERDPTESDFEELAVRAAVLRMDVGDTKNTKPTKSLSLRLSAALVKRVSRRRSSQASEAPFEAKEKVALLQSEEIARRFNVDGLEEQIQAQTTTQGTKISFAIWDYGGQEVFYALHHIFLTANGGLYVLVFNMQELVEDTAEAVRNLRFWLNSVKLHAPSAPIIIVGSHLTESTDLEAVESVLSAHVLRKLAFSTIPNSAAKLSFFPVDNLDPNPDRGAELRQVIEMTAATKVPAVSQKVSLRWLKVLDDLLMLDTAYVSFDQVRALAIKYKSGDQTEEMLGFFHDLGAVVHLRATSKLHDTVVLQPQWLLDKLARVIADDIHVEDLLRGSELDGLGLRGDFERLREEGIASQELFEYLWRDDKSKVGFLVDFMRDTMLLSDWRFGGGDKLEYLVTSLMALSAAEPEDLKASFAGGLTGVLDFSAFFLPDGVFQRLVSLSAARSSEAPKLSRNQAVMGNFALEALASQIWLHVHPRAAKPLSVLKMLVSMFRSVRDAAFKDLPWELLVQSDQGVLVSYGALVQEKEARDGFERFFDDDEGVGKLTDDSNKAPQEGDGVPAPTRGNRFHVFMSHRQSESSSVESCLWLADNLERRGVKVHFDQRDEAEVTAEEVERGVRSAQCYLVFLNKVAFDSSLATLELETARTAGKALISVHEADPSRVDFAPFSEYLASAPETWSEVFSEATSLALRRRYHEQEAFFLELITRITS